MEKELLINKKLYKFEMVNKRSMAFRRLYTIDIPINLDEIYDKYEFGKVENIKIVRDLLRGDSLNLNKDILGSVELYNAIIINCALIPYVVSCDVNMVTEFKKTLKFLRCYEEFRKYIEMEVSFLNLDSNTAKNVANRTERNILIKGYILLENDPVIVLKSIIDNNVKFYKTMYK